MPRVSILRRSPRAVAGAAALAALVAAAAPGAAQADATIGWNNINDPLHATALDYTAGQGRIDQVKVTHENGRIVFRSTTEHLKPATYNVQYSPAFTQCNQGPDLKTVVCEDQDVGTIRYWTWDGNDTVDHQVPQRADVWAGEGTDDVLGGPGHDTLHGEGGLDELFGRGGDDALDGGGSRDILDGGAGGDTLDGGAGRDLADYGARTAALTINVAQTGSDGAANEGDNVLPSVEDVTGGAGNDVITGSGEDNALRGGGGKDTLRGRGGNDALRGQQGNDTLFGESGRDELYGEDGGDRLYGGFDDDILLGGNQDDTLHGDTGADDLFGGTGADKLYGGTGVSDDYLDGGTGGDLMSAGPGSDDTVSYSQRTQPVTASIGGGADDGEAGEGDTIDGTIERIVGGKGADTLTGSAGANALVGGAGPDTLEGLGGSDQLFGQAGSDTMKAVDAIQDAVDCGADADSAQADAIDTLTACETVQIPMAPGNGQNGGQGNGGGQPQVQAAGPKVGLALAAGRVSTRGNARIRITCPKSAKVFCQGTLRLSRSGRHVGTKAFRVKAGRSTVVNVKVAFSARKAMGATRTARARGIAIRLTAVTRGQGTKSRTTTRLVRIKGAAKR